MYTCKYHINMHKSTYSIMNSKLFTYNMSFQNLKGIRNGQMNLKVYVELHAFLRDLLLVAIYVYPGQPFKFPY